MKKLLLLLFFAPALALAAEGDYPLDRAPNDPKDLVSLQAGARTFVNYCLGCHSMQYLRYNRLEQIGLTDEQIKDNLLFTADKIGEPMKIAMNPKAAKQWFGVAPPDLSLIARSRSADWLYTYLRAFYRDPKTATGWNNAVFENVAMPHVLWTLQGERTYDKEKHEWNRLTKGALSEVEYDATVRDLVNFLVFASEPAAQRRKMIGIYVLFALGIVFVFAWLLKREYWKDVK